MRAKLLINDTHLGVQRMSGTTPESASRLCEWLQQSVRDLMFQHTDKDIVINGDLFDQFQIAALHALGFYYTAAEWLNKARVIENPRNGKFTFPQPRLIIGRGNHDWSKDSSKLSSFDFVCRILAAQFGDRFVVVTEPKWLDDGIYMIPHMPNQELFDLELGRVGKAKPQQGRLLLHANYDNNFTSESDHSLNVSKAQAEKLVSVGWQLIFGHEHQARRMLAGKVLITGNQFSSSVADCLNNPDGKKYAHIITPNLQFEPVETWNAAADFSQVDWQNLAEYDGTAHFIRVTGTATAEQAPEMISAISKFRQANDAFVITNAVSVEGVRDMDDLPASMEDVKAFDVLGFLYEQLSEEQRTAVKKLLAGEEQQKEAA